MNLHRTGLGLVCLFITAACGPSIVLPSDDAAGIEDGGTASTSGGPGAGAGADVGTGADPTDPPRPTTGAGTTDAVDTGVTEGEGSVDGGMTFIDPTADGCDELPPGTLGHCTECDIFAQDCAEGEKCMPWANDGGGAWNATRCSPVADNPAQVGEACEVEGNGVSGLDNCDFGAMCFYVDPDTLQGACVALCEGTADDPMCIDNGVCTISGSGSLAVCLPSCNPLEDECPDNQTCTPTVSANGFTCTPLAPDPAAPGEACEFFSQCQSGSTCLSGDLIGCDAPGGCCTSFCDLALGQPNPDCPDPEHECLPWYERGEAPPGLDDVGVCGVP